MKRLSGALQIQPTELLKKYEVLARNYTHGVGTIQVAHVDDMNVFRNSGESAAYGVVKFVPASWTLHVLQAHSEGVRRFEVETFPRNYEWDSVNTLHNCWKLISRPPDDWVGVFAYNAKRLPVRPIKG